MQKRFAGNKLLGKEIVYQHDTNKESLEKV